MWHLAGADSCFHCVLTVRSESKTTGSVQEHLNGGLSKHFIACLQANKRRTNWLMWSIVRYIASNTMGKTKKIPLAEEGKIRTQKPIKRVSADAPTSFPMAPVLTPEMRHKQN